MNFLENVHNPHLHPDMGDWQYFLIISKVIQI